MSINGSTSPVPTLRHLNDEQVYALVTFASESSTTQDMTDVVKVILETGLRSGELCDLRFVDAEIISIDAEITGGRFSVKGKAPRFVPFGPATVKVLMERRESHPDSEYVLGESRQGLIKRVSRQLSSLAPRIGVRRLTLQTLRHTFFTRLAAAGAPAFVIKAIGGWKSWGLVAWFFRFSDPVNKREYDAALESPTSGQPRE
jgi:integrase